jgi:ribosomal protein L37E
MTTTTTAPTQIKPAAPVKARCVRCGRPLPKRHDQRCARCLGQPLRPPGWVRREYYSDPADDEAGN